MDVEQGLSRMPASIQISIVLVVCLDIGRELEGIEGRGRKKHGVRDERLDRGQNYYYSPTGMISALRKRLCTNQPEKYYDVLDVEPFSKLHTP